MLKRIFLTGAVLLAATPAAAADFAGPRAEVRFGWDRTTVEVEYDDGDTAFEGRDYDDGLGVGAEFGYDFAVGGAVVGGYAGVDFANTKECSEVFGNDEACVKLGRNFTLGARIGAAVTPSTLLYVKGGYSNGQTKVTYEDFADSDFNTTEKANRDGFHVGVGAEMNVSETGYAKLELIRTNYNDYGYSDDFVDASTDSRRTQATLGFGLRF